MSLHDVPADTAGISWEQWLQREQELIFAEARRKRNELPGRQSVRQDSRSDRDSAVVQPLFPVHNSYRE